MSEENTIFIYRPPGNHAPETKNVTMGVKFAKGVHFLDPWGFMLIGKTRWQRVIFRLKNPIPYTKRGWKRFYYRVKRIFIKDYPTIHCFERKKEEENDNRLH